MVFGIIAVWSLPNCQICVSRMEVLDGLRWPSRSSEDSGELLYTYRGIRTQEAFLNYLEFMSRDNVRLAHSLEEIQALSEEVVRYDLNIAVCSVGSGCLLPCNPHHSRPPG